MRFCCRGGGAEAPFLGALNGFLPILPLAIFLGVFAIVDETLAYRLHGCDMQIFLGHREVKESWKHAVVSVGNFDGVHLGHQEIIRVAQEEARLRQGVCIAYTFKPHPQEALYPERHIALLMTYEEKVERLKRLGLNALIEEPFSREFSNMSAELFFNDVLIHRLSAEAIVVGYDFAFGNDRQGNQHALERLCHESGVSLKVVPPFRVKSDVVSSSKIRSYLHSGDLSSACALLGYDFFYCGVIVRGEGRGQKIGFRTANLQLSNKLKLPHGVYVTIAKHQGRDYPSVTNVGVRPTFKSDKELAALVETHLLDTDIDLYGATIEVRFIQKLREEIKFSGIEPLREQIGRDIAIARSILTGPSTILKI